LAQQQTQKSSPQTQENQAKKPEDILGKPMQRYRFEIEEASAGVERFYFWFVNFLKSSAPSGVACTNVWKIKDIYAATETSSYFGAIEQKKGLQQDRVSQYLATIGKMVKDLFQIIRELRIMDERFSYYDDSRQYYIQGPKTGEMKTGKDLEASKDAEVALKSIWIDMVEGGAKNPTSVLGLASQVGFTILPDLFFTIQPKDKNSINGEMEKLEKEGINRKTREVLGRKLYQYLDWKEKTEREIRQRKGFMLKYLRQHYNTIKMYMNWVRPYLKNLKRLQMKQDSEDTDLIAAFESSKIELEVLGTWGKSDDAYYPCIRITFEYVTIPQMAYQQEYQRGAIHVGRSVMYLESYAIEKEKVEEYREARDKEDFELIEGVTSAMDALKEDMQKYLKEAGEVVKEEEKKEEKKEQLSMNPFKGIGRDFRLTFGIPEKGEKKKGKVTSSKLQGSKKAAQSKAQGITFTIYDIFKKAHRMLSW